MADINVLRTWRSLLETIGGLTEEECQELLEYEREHAGRPQVLLRLYGRMNKLKTTRERKEIMQ